MSYVFISYSRNDREYAFKLKDYLEYNGFSTWIDDDIQGGNRWWKEIEKAIENCAACVVIMTPSSNASEFVEKEYMNAAAKGKQLLPLLLEGSIFGYFVNIECEILDGTRDHLPSIKWLERLQDYAKRLPQKREPSKEAPKIEHFQYPPRDLVISINEWSDYIKIGSTDFYGIAMLALSYEERERRERAVYLLKKSYKLEPRVVNPDWMEKHYNWSSEHCKLLDKIISDPLFWSPKIN